MKPLLNEMTKYLSSWLLLLTSVSVLSSCIGDDVLTDACIKNDEIEISFTLVADNTNATRAEDEPTWGGDYNKDLGTLYETYVNPEDLQVLVYDATALKYITKVENLTCYRIDESDNKHIYNYTGKIAVDNLTDNKFNARLVVLANCPTYTPAAGDAYSDMAKQLYEYTASDYYAASSSETPSKYIPMWGVKCVDTSLTAGWATNIGDINLLRTMAKVKVTISAEGATLSSVKLDRHSTKGYIVPKGYQNITDITSLYTDNESADDASFNPYTGEKSIDVSPIPFIKVSDTEYYIYVPEYDNSNDDASITVEAGPEGSQQKYTFKIEKYNDDEGNALETSTAVNLVRNHIYQYDITSISSGTATIQFTELPWNLVESEIGWEVSASEPFDATLYAWKNNRAKSIKVNGTSTNFMNVPSIDDATEGDPEAVFAYVSFPKYYDSDGEPEYLQDVRGGAAFYFIATQPTGAVWTAHLTNTDDFEFETSTGETWDYYLDPADKSKVEEHYCATTGIIRGTTTVTNSEGKEYTSFQPYKIMVKPKAGHRWYSFADGAKTTTKDKKTVYSIEDNWDNYITLSGTDEDTWGGTYWESQYGDASGPYTDLYITVSLDGTNEKLVPINPVVSSDITTYYKDSDGNKRRFATGDKTTDRDYYVRIWQLKARRDDSDSSVTKYGYDNEGMATANTANSTFSKDNK